MKVFLDDVRNAPDSSWVVVRTTTECVKLLKTGKVTHLSLDHDLGEDLPQRWGYGEPEPTGHDVLIWMENAVVRKGFVPPKVLLVHSANPVGKARMLQAVEKIRKLSSEAQADW